MPTPVINYAGSPWTAGASWQTNQYGNFGTQEVTNFSNGSNGTLWTGDVVVLGSGGPAGTIPDVTALSCDTTTTVSSPYVVGVVGGMTNMAGAGGPVPFQTPAWRYDSATTAVGTTVTDTFCVAGDLGKAVIGPGVPSGAFIVAVTPGTSFVLSVAATAAATVTLAIGPVSGSVSAGFPGIPPGDTVPVVMQGWAYVNVGANTVAAGNLLTTSGTARIGSVVTSAATLIGTFIGVALEAQNAAGTITSGDGSASRLVRAWITKF